MIVAKNCCEWSERRVIIGWLTCDCSESMVGMERWYRYWSSGKMVGNRTFWNYCKWTRSIDEMYCNWRKRIWKSSVIAFKFKSNTSDKANWFLKLLLIWCVNSTLFLYGSIFKRIHYFHKLKTIWLKKDPTARIILISHHSSSYIVYIV